MALDGSEWNEASPDNSDLVNEGDNNFRDVKKGVSGRMSHEHIWPSSQSATNEAGLHRFITMSAQTSTPALVVGTNTQAGALFIKSSGQDLAFVSSASAEVLVVNSANAGVNVLGGFVSGATQGDMLITTSGSGGATMTVLSAGSPGYVIVSSSAGAAPTFAPVAARAWMCFNGTGSVLGSYNCSGFNRDAAGEYTITFSAAFDDTKFAVVGFAKDSLCFEGTGRSTTTCQITCREQATTVHEDSEFINVIVFATG